MLSAEEFLLKCPSEIMAYFGDEYIPFTIAPEKKQLVKAKKMLVDLVPNWNTPQFRIELVNANWLTLLHKALEWLPAHEREDAQMQVANHFLSVYAKEHKRGHGFSFIDDRSVMFNYFFTSGYISCLNRIGLNLESEAFAVSPWTLSNLRAITRNLSEIKRRLYREYPDNPRFWENYRGQELYYTY